MAGDMTLMYTVICYIDDVPCTTSLNKNHVLFCFNLSDTLSICLMIQDKAVTKSDKPALTATPNTE